MGCKIRDHRRFDNTSGVSEIIGAVLLITLVVAAVSVVAVVLFSQPTPKEVPNLNFMTGMNTSRNTLYLYHNGGDPLNAGEFSVLVDGVPKAYTISGGGSQWSLGKNLVIAISPPHVPDRVQIIYNGTSMGGGSVGSGVVLREASSTNIVNSANISPDQAPYLDCAAVRNWACATQIPPEIISAMNIANLTAQRILLMKNNQGSHILLGGAGYHFNVTIADPGASMILGDNNCALNSQVTIPLGPNDMANLTFNNDPSEFTLYGMAPSIWEMTGGVVTIIRLDFYNASTATKTVYDGSKRVCHTNIPKYSRYDSTLTVTTDNSNSLVALTVNSTKVLEGSFLQPITLKNMRPTNNGLFLISYTSGGAPLYIITWADEIQYNGVPQTGLGL